MMILSKRTSRRLRKALHGFVTIVSAASILASSVSASFAQGIIVDPSAPGTSFLQSSNGTPQVNVKTPQSGVSLNRFTKFNVGNNGLILNNSTTSGVSMIGQNVTANPNLMVSGPANMIVTEVTGTKSSTMTGKTEVFGRRAAVIVANPNGIVCNGCAFLNTTSSTLTTGKPTVSGSRVDLMVTKGTVTIGSDGFNPGTQGGIIGRHVILTGPVVTSGQGAGNDLLVSGGAQQVQGLNGSDLSASPNVAASSTVAKTSPFAIDASEGGRFTGGDVIIRNPEVGQGVNLYGTTDGRSLTASSGGSLFYKDIEVDTTATLAGSELRQYGTLTAGGDVTIQGRAFTLYDGRVIETSGNVDITADEFVVIAGEVSGNNVRVDVTTGTLTNNGFLMADGDLTVVAGEHVSQQRQIAREYDIYFDPALQQYVQAYYAQLAAGGPSADLAAEMIARASRHELVAEYIEKGAISTGTNVSVTAEGNINNEGGAIAATQDVRLMAGANIFNTYLALRSRLDAGDECSSEDCSYRTDFHGAEILAGRDLILTAGLNVENHAGDLAAADSVSLTAGQDVENMLFHSSFTASEVVPVTTPTSVIRTRCSGKDSICRKYVTTENVTSNEFHYNEGTVFSPGRIMSLYGNIDIAADRHVVSTGSLLSSGGDLTLSAGAQTRLTNYTGVESEYVRRINRSVSNVCTTGKNSTCSLRTTRRTVTDNKSTVLATATSNLIGDKIAIKAAEDVTLIGAQLLAESDLSLTSTGGAVLIDGADLPGFVARDGSKTPQLVELDADLTKTIFGPTGRTTTSETGEAYIAFLQENDLLTAMEALRRANSGANIKDAARAVGVQSYVSLADNSKLESLRKEAKIKIAAASSGTSAAMRRAETVLQQEAESDALRGEAAAQGSIVEGEKSLAAALTNETFPELTLTETVVTTSAGIVENRRNGDERRTRLVTKTRDVGEYRDVQSTRREVRYNYTCSGYGKERSCRNTRYYVTVPFTETRWVVTGTEQYQARETYLDGVASRKALISPDKATQDAFLAATAWRFGSGGTPNTGNDIPWNQLLANGGDLTLNARTSLLIEDGSVEVQGLLNTTSLGNTTLRSADVRAGDVRLVAGGALGAEAVHMDIPGNASLFGTTGVSIMPRAWEYSVTDTKAPVIGQLAAKDWGILADQTLVSQELSEFVVGGNLDLNTLGTLTVGGTRVEVGNNLTITTSGDLRLTAPRSAIEYHVGDSRNGTDLWDVRAHKTEITADGDVTGRASGVAFLEGTGIDAQGVIDLASGGDLILSAAQDVREYRYRRYKKNFFRKKTYRLSETRVTNDGVDLSATGDIDLESTGGDLTAAGAQLESRTGDVNISATEGDIYAGAFTDVDRREEVSRKSTFFGLFSSGSSSLVDTRRTTGTGALASANLSLVSGGNTTLIGARLSAGGDLNLNVGGDLDIQAAIDSERKEFFESKVGAIFATTETERSNRETAILTSLSAGGDISFSVGGKTHLTLYSTPSKDSPSVAELYPGELEALAGLVLLDQELLDEYFRDKTKTLSPVFTMALTWALTSGFKSLLTSAGVPGLTFTNPAGTTKLTHAGKAVASTAASTTVGIANGTVSGKLDLGQILKNAAIAAGTSYLTRSINLKAMGQGQEAALAAEAQGNAAFSVVDDLGTRTLLGSAWDPSLTTSVFGQNLTVADVLEGTFDATLSASIKTAAHGRDFGDSFKSSFIKSVVALGLKDAQAGIDNVFAKDQNNGEWSLGYVLVYGLAGCVAAEARGANCGEGALRGIDDATEITDAIKDKVKRKLKELGLLP